MGAPGVYESNAGFLQSAGRLQFFLLLLQRALRPGQEPESPPGRGALPDARTFDSGLSRGRPHRNPPGNLRRRSAPLPVFAEPAESPGERKAGVSPAPQLHRAAGVQPPADRLPGSFFLDLPAPAHTPAERGRPDSETDEPELLRRL